MRDKRLDNLGKGVYWILVSAFMVFSFWFIFLYDYGPSIWLQISYNLEAVNIGLSNGLSYMFFLAIIGGYALALLFTAILHELLWPKKEDELKLIEEKKKIDKKYPEKLARLMKRELKYKFKIKRLSKDISEYKEKNQVN